LRTIVYVDGYNLYYGRLTRTDHKWLDVVQLVESLVKGRSADDEVAKVCYFTAPVLARFARRGKDSVSAQNAYHAALAHRHGDRFEKICGSHQASTDRMMRVVADQGPDHGDRVEVWRLNEKQTDVNIAVRMYRDAVHGACEQMVICTNDTDAEPVLKAIREDYPSITLGVIAPIRPIVPKAGSEVARPMSSLRKCADWSIPHITEAQLRAALMPERIAREGRKALLRPAHWAPAAQLAITVAIAETVSVQEPARG
jgi:hypothetical protein